MPPPMMITRSSVTGTAPRSRCPESHFPDVGRRRPGARRGRRRRPRPARAAAARPAGVGGIGGMYVGRAGPVHTRPWARSMFGASRSVPPGPASGGLGAAGKEVVAVPDGLDEHEQPVEHQEGTAANAGRRLTRPSPIVLLVAVALPARNRGSSSMPPRFRSAWPDVASLPGRLQGGHCTGAEHRHYHPRHHPVHLAGGPPEQHRHAGSTTSCTTSRARLRLQGVHHRRPAGGDCRRARSRHPWMRDIHAVQGGVHPVPRLAPTPSAPRD